jgi:hypothetical protein
MFVRSGLADGNSGTSGGPTLTGVANGNAVIGWVCWYHATATVTGVADADGAYTLGTAVNPGDLFRAVPFYKHISGATGNKTVTATFSTAPTFWSVIACEITGHDSGDVFEAQAANYQAALGTGTDNITSGTVTPAPNGAFLFGWHGNLNSKSSTVGTGWTQRQTNAFWAGASQTLEQGTAGAQASLRNCTAADGNWLSVVMAANAAGGGGGAPALNVGSIGEPVVGGSVF